MTKSRYAALLTQRNPNSLKAVTAIVEPALASAKADDKFQFERHGYFVADRVEHAAGRPVFNLAVGLRIVGRSNSPGKRTIIRSG